jgi:hypothetical protein
LGTIELGANRAYLEERLKGSIGWKLARNARLEPHLFNEVYQFARDFACATRSEAQLTSERLDELL